ncbi:MAG: phosphoglycerate dehydrogenase, partial [Thermoguttaceae bacterium]|nr:phosphoglycerate dehydrogenase [Thermoguttaceae bacterium]
LYNKLRIDAHLDGALLVTTQPDQPGVVAALGATSAKYGVNIAHMTLGRNLHAPDGDAVSVLALDGVVPPELVADVAALPQIHSVVAAQLPEPGQYPSWMN